MTESDVASVPPGAPDRPVALSTALAPLWLALARVTSSVGWQRLQAQPPTELGQA